MVDAPDAASIFEALGHPARLQLLRCLIPEGPVGLPAGTIAERLSLPQTALSFHLNRMKQVRLIEVRREGRNLFYAVNYAVLTTVTDFLTEDCCALAPAGCLPGCAGERGAAPSPRKVTRATPAKAETTRG